MRRFGDGRDWFFERRYGLFVHWGLYAVSAWHEQEQWRRRVPRAEYEQRLDQFNPTRFDPERWLDLAESVGMQYLCVTTKHHDGFCLWATRHTAFNVMRSPYGRDIIGMLADACHRRHFPLCLYYSCVDWHHPNYPHQGRHHELAGPEPGDVPDIDRYMAFLRDQVRELCTDYGEIHGFFWDMNVPELHDPSINAMVRSLQPKAVINNRGFDAGDYDTPERHVPDGRRFERPTEANQSLGRESWGYRRDEDYYTTKHLVQSFDKILAMGGNYLLNVGPKADGAIPSEAVAGLHRIREWYGAVREAFDGAQPASELTENQNVLLTRKGTTLYVHCFQDPDSTAVYLRPLDRLPLRATLLNTGADLEARLEVTPRYWQEQPCLRIRGLPADGSLNTVMVLKLEFDCLPTGPPG